MGHVRDRAAFRLKKLSEADHAQPQAEHQKKGESERDSPFSGTVYFSVNHRNVKYRKHHFYLEPQRFQAFFYALHCGFRMFSSCFHNHFTTFRILCQPHLCDICILLKNDINIADPIGIIPGQNCPIISPAKLSVSPGMRSFLLPLFIFLL